MMKLKILQLAVGLTLLLCFTSCQKNAKDGQTSISRKDTIAIIETALADSALNSAFLHFYDGKQLKLLTNKFVPPDYELVLKDKPVLVVSYDSTLHNPIPPPNMPQFFGEVLTFKMQPDQQIEVFLWFHGSNFTADFKIKRSNDKWRVTKRVFGRY